MFWAATLQPDSGRKLSSRSVLGRARRVLGTIRSQAAPWRRASISTPSNWRPKDSLRAERLVHRRHGQQFTQRVRNGTRRGAAGKSLCGIEGDVEDATAQGHKRTGSSTKLYGADLGAKRGSRGSAFGETIDPPRYVLQGIEGERAHRRIAGKGGPVCNKGKMQAARIRKVIGFVTGSTLHVSQRNRHHRRHDRITGTLGGQTAGLCIRIERDRAPAGNQQCGRA